MHNINKDLHDYIYNVLGATNIPLGERRDQLREAVKFNLHNGREENLKYLGTYFPRSFIESYEIFNMTFHRLYDRGYLNFPDNAINILDVGSGTGGQLFGLLEILSNKLEKSHEINIFSIDGNKDKLDVQHEIFYYLNAKSYKNKHNIVLGTHHKEFNNQEDLKEYLTGNFSNINIILSFKFISELILMCQASDNGWYTTTLESAEDILSKKGLMLLLDVNTSTDRRTLSKTHKWLPMYFNKEASEYVKGKTTLFCILPMCCSKNIKSCTREDCYTCIPIASGEYVNYKVFVKHDCIDFNSDTSHYCFKSKKTSRCCRYNTDCEKINIF